MLTTDKFKIDKVYSYSEVREGQNIYFGWTEGGDLFDELIVISSPASSLKDSSDKDWSLKEGVTASNISHYKKWFEANCSSSPEDFLKIWAKNKVGLELFQKNKNKSYRDGEGEFLLKLAALIQDGKKFTMFGRTYKVVSTKED